MTEIAAQVFLVDDEANIRRMLAALLRDEGFAVAEAANGNAALLQVEQVNPDVILLDLLMPPGPDGLETLARLRERGITTPVIMMSGKAQLTDAVRAVKLGAFQFLEKPLAPEAVLVTVRAALELNRTRAENRALHAELARRETLLGESPAMRQVRALVERVAPTEARVLVTGESGTGKELVAVAVHRASRRADRPFVTVNCAAIPRDLVESEMFGHERGAFTGATERRLGRFELAHGGTLFLDEIGDLSAEAQAKLLRTLETGELQRIGAEGTVRVDVRV
ncbi:MAG TPA: sigma-54 dependent transcriptional regulator, partial [Gemmatimonadales bacterium]|nr:sigma-54 dependent transcriptional regulator [Gemmatimonadales bacterium]